MKQKKLPVVLLVMVYLVQIFFSTFAFADDNSTDSKTGQAKQVTVFNDLNGHWAQNQIQFLADKSYIKGYAANGGYSIKPDANITRAEYLSVLIKTKKLSVISKNVKPFNDVKASDCSN
ncbi:MAG TPA: S-layer homology domain-containing protein [Pseudobacteroides sp.]|uniref:S-layer homology domain-containing protein n=1 Tax=Pseudobacteroides sp. TaxID=1968840 RepID=UPI002F932475